MPYGHAPVTALDFSIIPEDFTDEPNDKLNNVLELVGKKVAAGEKVIIYTAWVRLDTQPLLTDRLKEMGIKACILKQNVKAIKREDWVQKKLNEGMQVLITNPKLVETGRASVRA